MRVLFRILLISTILIYSNALIAQPYEYTGAEILDPDFNIWAYNNTISGVPSSGYVTGPNIQSAIDIRIAAIGGDNLGNHSATMSLEMNTNDINDVNIITIVGDFFLDGGTFSLEGEEGLFGQTMYSSGPGGTPFWGGSMGPFAGQSVKLKNDVNSQDLNTAGLNNVIFGNTVFNDNVGLYNVVVTGEIIVLQAGRYEVCYDLDLTSTGVNVANAVAIYKNATPISPFSICGISGIAGIDRNDAKGCVIENMIANDIITIGSLRYATDATAINMVGTDNYFTIRRIN